MFFELAPTFFALFLPFSRCVLSHAAGVPHVCGVFQHHSKSKRRVTHSFKGKLTGKQPFGGVLKADEPSMRFWATSGIDLYLFFGSVPFRPLDRWIVQFRGPKEPPKGRHPEIKGRQWKLMDTHSKKQPEKGWNEPWERYGPKGFGSKLNQDLDRGCSSFPSVAISGLQYFDPHPNGRNGRREKR